MSDTTPADVTVSEHAVPGGKEVDVTITVPTPASQVNPDTVVVPANDPGNSVPTPAGIIADTHGPDTPVVSPGVDPFAPSPSGTSTAGDATSAPTTDVPATVPAGQVDSGTSVARVDDPDKTLVPAGDLPPGVEVHNPDPAAPPIPNTGPVTAAELAARVRPRDGTTLTTTEVQAVMDELDAAGYVIVRK